MLQWQRKNGAKMKVRWQGYTQRAGLQQKRQPTWASWYNANKVEYLDNRRRQKLKAKLAKAALEVGNDA